MESQFEIDVTCPQKIYCPLPHAVIFLHDKEYGLRVPIALTEDELADLEVAIQIGTGATPPQIQGMVSWLKDLTITKIGILDFDVEKNDFSAAVWATDSKLAGRFMRLNVVQGLMLSVHAGISPSVNHTAIAHQMDSPRYSPIFESFKQLGDYEGQGSH